MSHGTSTVHVTTTSTRVIDRIPFRAQQIVGTEVAAALTAHALPNARCSGGSGLARVLPCHLHPALAPPHKAHLRPTSGCGREARRRRPTHAPSRSAVLRAHFADSGAVGACHTTLQPFSTAIPQHRPSGTVAGAPVCATALSDQITNAASAAAATGLS